MWGLHKHTATHAVLAALLAAAGVTAAAEEPDEPAGTNASANRFMLGGYARLYSSWNLSNTPETVQNDSGDLSMLRGSLLLDGSYRNGPVSVRVTGRADREHETDYLQRLGDLGANSHAGAGRVMDLYDHGELREAYVSIDATKRLNLKIGKQQVVWGESDFFHAMDLVNGFNTVWAPPTEESDETRKGLVMVNAKLSVPQVDGALQVLFRPGLDRDRDIGNTPDIYGGRNAGIFYRGFDARNIVNMDYRHPDGDVKKNTWGTRWSGTAAGLSYSIAYLKTFTPNFVINSRAAPYMKTPTGVVGDLIFPKMDVLGATVNGYSATTDAVLAAEVAYQRDVAYNVGTGPAIGLGGVLKKNQVRSMLRMDKNINLSAIGSGNPSLWSVQIFDTWIQNFKDSDDLVLIPTYGRPAKKHETVITNIFGLNYRNNNVNPTLVLAYDVTNGGGFVVPYVDFVMGDNWRLRAEIDYFYHRRQGTPADRGDAPTNFGLAAHNNQFMLRLTRQF